MQMSVFHINFLVFLCFGLNTSIEFQQNNRSHLIVLPKVNFFLILKLYLSTNITLSVKNHQLLVRERVFACAGVYTNVHDPVIAAH